MKHIWCLLLRRRYRWSVVHRTAFRVIEQCGHCNAERIRYV